MIAARCGKALGHRASMAPRFTKVTPGSMDCGTRGDRPVFIQTEWIIGEKTMGKGLLLWLIGVPIPVILLLWLFFH